MPTSEDKKIVSLSDDESYKKMVEFLLQKFFLDMEVTKEKGKILGQAAEDIITEQKLKKIKQVISKH